MPIIVAVAPEGDGNSFRASYGSFDTWNDHAFQSVANPVQAHHSYDYSWHGGEIKIAYLQISLEDIPAGFDVTSSGLNLHITNVGGNGATLKHRSDSASATSHANQELSGDVDVAVLDTGIGTAWHRIDVTDYIRSSKQTNWARRSTTRRVIIVACRISGSGVLRSARIATTSKTGSYV